MRVKLDGQYLPQPYYFILHSSDRVSFVFGGMSLKASAFGEIKVNGQKYNQDIILHVDGSITKRKKKKSKEFKPMYGHTPLSEKELDFLEEEQPEAVYIGTGYDGALPITEKAQAILSKYETKAMKTSELPKKIDAEKRKKIAIIHVTC